MRKILAILMLMILPGLLLKTAEPQAIFFSQNVRPASGGSAPTVGNTCTPTPTGTPTTISCSVTASAGDTLWVGSNWNDNHTVTCTDSTSQTCSVNSPTTGGPYPVQWTSAANQQIWTFTLKNATAGSHTITLTDSATPGATPFMIVVAIHGANATTPYDVGTALATLSGSFPGGTFTSSSFTTTSANELVISMCVIGHNDPVSVVSPMVLITNSGGQTNNLAGGTTLSSTGSHTTSCTEPFSDDIVISTDAYKP